jgi:hypothetical protein
MSGMDPQHPSPGHKRHDALAAYALGLLDDEERQDIEAHLASCSACRAELSRYEDVVGDLGAMAAPVPPDPALRDRLIADVRSSASLPSSRRRHVPLAWMAIAASIAVISLVALGFLLAITIEERDDARHSEREIAEYLRDGGTLSALVPAPGAPDDVAEGHGTLAIVPDGSRAMLIVYDLPPSGGAHRYLAWAERDSERVELGDLVVNDQGVGWLLLYGPDPMSSYDTVGITRYAPTAPDGEPFLIAPVR